MPPPYKRDGSLGTPDNGGLPAGLTCRRPTLPRIKPLRLLPRATEGRRGQVGGRHPSPRRLSMLQHCPRPVSVSALKAAYYIRGSAIDSLRRLLPILALPSLMQHCRLLRDRVGVYVYAFVYQPLALLACLGYSKANRQILDVRAPVRWPLLVDDYVPSVVFGAHYFLPLFKSSLLMLACRQIALSVPSSISSPGLPATTTGRNSPSR